jgi:hypothetical protein
MFLNFSIIESNQYREVIKMKAIQLFSGHDSFGRNVHVAQGEDGSWFFRTYGFNGYGSGWDKWTLLGEYEPTYKTKIINVYDFSETEIESGELLEWGFTCLHKIEENTRIRLP